MADKIITLKNDALTVEVSTKGAEIQSIVNKKGTSFLWSGDKEVWSGRAPVLFPICGGLKDDKYILGGKEYSLVKHGFAKTVFYEVEKSTELELSLLYKPEDDTKASFPYDYEFRVLYSLCKSSLKVTYKVNNLSDKTMYFSTGAHEAYACPEGIEEYSIVFDKAETLDSYILDGNLLEHNTIRIMENSKELPLKYDFFKVDAIVFKNLNSRKVTLVKRNGKRKVQVEFPGHDYFVLWTKPQAKYICIEPWCGIQDPVDSDYDITHKEGIIALPKGESFEASHVISVED
ncbi:MAG: aldose 1-epimerase family protein [Bacillota bacterium]|nr:aldose 1-epimerase family protein [Bacillota bacterium]